MKHSTPRTILAGVAGGLALNIVMLLTFRLIGFGWDGGGFLLDPDTQSEKLIAVWTRIEPLPLIVTSPAVMAAGLILFGVGHAFVYRWLSALLPPGVLARAVRFGALIFFLSFVFFEFFTPFNLFGEPPVLLLAELVFWACVAFGEAWAIAAVMERNAGKSP